MNNKKTLRIYLDEDATDPRENDNLGTLACWHRQYTLGDTQPQEDPRAYQACLPKGSLIVPVYLFDHSGIALSTKDFGDPWDSGQVGIYHVSPEQIIDTYGDDLPQNMQKAREAIETEVEQYSSYLGGSCWGFEVLDDQGNHIDGCGGFIGSSPLDNGLADEIEDDLLDQLGPAAKKAGFELSDREIELYMEERAAATVRRTMAHRASPF